MQAPDPYTKPFVTISRRSSGREGKPAPAGDTPSLRPVLPDKADRIGYTGVVRFPGLWLLCSGSLLLGCGPRAGRSGRPARHRGGQISYEEAQRLGLSPPATQFSPRWPASSFRGIRQVEDEIIRRVNAVRKNRGSALLRLDPRLRTAARQHSLEMVRLGYLRSRSPVTRWQT